MRPSVASILPLCAFIPYDWGYDQHGLAGIEEGVVSLNLTREKSIYDWFARRWSPAP